VDGIEKSSRGSKRCFEKSGSAGTLQGLDFGGGPGKMLADIDAEEKAVFDVVADPRGKGVRHFSSLQDLGSKWDLVLSCQVVEHLTDRSNRSRLDGT
jgi:hypothetical protein